jgi:glyoxylase-like metal-dependent hydrolase (beta-lactamase superfamily II)
MKPDATEVEPGVLPTTWVDGNSSCEPGSPEFRVHEYNPDFVILRQSGCTNFEKPFLYLVFGEEKALLVDTGAPGADVRGAVREVVLRWSERRGRRTVPLVVAHSHGHDDHTAGDRELGASEGTTVVPATVERLKEFFGIASWPDTIVPYDLGNRVIDVIPIPGHQVASVAYYDRRTGVLLTGDTLYPGRLYVRDPGAFLSSITRLVDFTRGRNVAHVLGAHIENTSTPYVDYPVGTTYQPEEHVLELGSAHLVELWANLEEMGARIDRRRARDFTIWPIEK